MPADVTFLKQFERQLTLDNGTRVRVRPIRPDDAPRLVAMYDRLSRDTAYHRFFAAMRRLPPDWARFLAGVDYTRRFALVAERPMRKPGLSADAEPDVEVIAVARYEPAEPGTAEVAFVVQDGWQGLGLGRLLLHQLLVAARANGVQRFRAWVLADNRRMLDLLERFTDVRERTLQAGVVELIFVPRTPRCPGA
jgi:RimJ/RimL family protein N-acetyltransferase